MVIPNIFESPIRLGGYVFGNVFISSLLSGELIEEYEARKQEAQKAEEDTNASFQKKKEVKKVSSPC